MLISESLLHIILNQIASSPATLFKIQSIDRWKRLDVYQFPLSMSSVRPSNFDIKLNTFAGIFTMFLSVVLQRHEDRKDGEYSRIWSSCDFIASNGKFQYFCIRFNSILVFSEIITVVRRYHHFQLWNRFGHTWMCFNHCKALQLMPGTENWKTKLLPVKCDGRPMVFSSFTNK